MKDLAAGSVHSEEGADHADQHAEEFDVHAHVMPVPFYLGIFGALIALTLATVGVSYIHLGALNLAVAIVIASAKAALVVLFFMHLKYDSKFNAVIFVSSLLFIGVFFAYTSNDTAHRAELDEAWGGKVFSESGEVAPGGFDPKQEAPKGEEGKQVLPKTPAEHFEPAHAAQPK